MATDISNPSNLLAAVDMGTNSFKMLVVRAEPNGRFLTVDRLKEPVVLGRGMNPNIPTINLEAQHRAISAIHKFRNFLHNQQVEHTKFVATSAVREAVNKGEFLSTIEEETCCKVEILSGEEEARLVYIGVLQFLPIYDKTVLTIDIGGGSTEFVVGKQGKVIFAISLKLGHVSLTEAFAKNGEIGNMRNYIRSVIYESGLVEKVRNVGFEIAVGSSGTIRSIEKAVYMGYAQDLMSAVVSYGVFKRNWKFSRKDLSCVVEKLCDKDQREDEDVRRNRFFKRRSEFILAGAVLLSEIFEILDIDEMEVSEYALGEGVIAETIAQCCSVFDLNANARWRSVIRLSSRFNSDKRMKSATRCAGIAREFFVGLRKYDGLGDHPNGCMLELDWKDLEYLEAACLLHNIGLYIGKKGYHKQSYHIIKNGDYLQGYSAEEVELIALLARYHQKKFPKSDDSSFHLFPDKVKEKFSILCAIVRISVAVEQCLFATFQRLEISSCPERLELLEIEPKLDYCINAFVKCLAVSPTKQVLTKSRDQPLHTAHVQPTLEDVEAELTLELNYFEQVFKKKLSVTISSSS